MQKIIFFLAVWPFCGAFYGGITVALMSCFIFLPPFEADISVLGPVLMNADMALPL